MSFTEWSNKKKQEEQNALPTSAAKPSTSPQVGAAPKPSFTDWSNQRRAESPTSLQEWADTSSHLIRDFQERSKSWYDEREYTSRFDNFSKLLSQADGWRKQYWGNQEAVSYIDSVVSAITDAKNSLYSNRKFYSQWDTADDYRAYLQSHKEVFYPDFKELSGYSSTKSSAGGNTGQYGMGYDDLAYEYINGANSGLRDAIKRQHRLANYGTSSKSDFEKSGFDYLTADEIGIYNYYYAKEGKEKAEEYLSSISKNLEARANNKTVSQVSAFADKHPVLSSAASVITSLGSSLEYAGEALGYGIDKLRGKETTMPTNNLALITNAARGAVADKVDWEIGNWDAFDFLYSTAMSGADSLSSGLLFGNAGGAVLGLSAAAQGTNDALQRGMSDGQAFWNGLFSGVFEGLFETVSIGQFNRLKEVAPNSIKDIFKNLGKSMLVNASEETLTEIANIGYDTLINGEFANYTWEELKGGAWKDALLQVVEAGASGALMGAGMSAVGSTIGYFNGQQHENDTPPPDSDIPSEQEKVKSPLTTELTNDLLSSAESSVVEEDITTTEPVTLEALSKKYGKQAKAMEANYMEGQDLEEYDRAFQMAYDMGRSGVSKDYVMKSRATSYLSESQREIAYEIGEAAASETANAQAATNNAAANGKTGWRKGAVRGLDVKIEDMSKAFNDPQRKAYKYLSSIAEVTGIDIVLYKSEVGQDGKYQGNTEGSFKWNEDTIYLDINAGLESYKDAESLAKYTMMRAYTHEFTHFIEKWNPEEYNGFRKTVFATMEQNGENVEDLIDTILAKSSGSLSYEQASREVIAEAMTDILPETAFIEQLAQKNQNVFQQLLSKLKEFVASLKKHFSSMGTSTREAKALKKQVGETLSYMEDIVRKFDKVAVKAVENYQQTVAEETAAAVKESTTQEKEPPKAIRKPENKSVKAESRDNEPTKKSEPKEAKDASSEVSTDPAYVSENGYTITDGTKPGYVEVRFDDKPGQNILDAIKSINFRWSKVNKTWYGKAARESVAEVLDAAYHSQEKVTQEPAAEDTQVYETVSESGDVYDALKNTLSAVNVYRENGFEFKIRLIPGAGYNGIITRTGYSEEYVANARDLIFDQMFSDRVSALEYLTDVARSNKLLEPWMDQQKAKTERLNEKFEKHEQKQRTASENLAERIVSDYIDQKKPLTAKELYALADEAFGGTQAVGAYNRKDAYDAMELAVNKHLLAAAKAFNGDQNTAVDAVKYMQSLLELLPTQSVRTQEQQDFQQFSTPPNIAYLAAWAANISDKDSVLEPSAGIGGLAVFAKSWGAEVTVNELSKRRLEVLRAMGFDHLFNENAEQIDNILPDSISPSVVIMNPPFSSTAGRTKGNKTSNAEKHIDQALMRLQDGGRLIAILGKGMNDQDYYRYWDSLRKSYNIRANLSIDGDNYKKYGTTWGVQIVVIDKTGPQTGETVTGKFTDLTQVPSVLEGIRNDRSNMETGSPGSNGNRVGESVADGGNAGDPDTGHSGSGERSSGSAAQSERKKNRKVAGTAERTGGRTDRKAATETGREAPERQDGRGVGVASGTDSGNGNGADAAGNPDRHKSELPLEGLTEPEEVSDDGVYATFVLPDIPVKGSRKHPAVLVESAAMSAVSMPKATYSPKLPAEVVKNNLSDAQTVTITYAGQAHEQKLPDGSRRGFFIGDGTGVGKGRQIAGIILDNFMQGRDKAVWISKNDDLYGDAVRDWTQTTGRSKEEVVSQGKYKPSDKITLKSGVLFTSYGKLKMEKGGNRLEQIVDWVGKDFDGVIAFDEAHFMGNLFGKKGKFGKAKGSLTAKAGVDLQRKLPNARIVYVSATAATEVDNLAYAERLGLWGPGTAFTNSQDFITKIGASGLAAMELVIRDMKAMGSYVARSISYNGVSYDTVEHTLEPMQEEIYNTMSRAWQKTMSNVQSALATTGGKYNSTERQRAMGNFYSSMQRFYNQVLTSMAMPSVIADMRKELAEGHSCVMQIVNTNEAQQNKQLAEAKAKGESLDNLDMTPREALIGYLNTSFPTQMFEEYTDDDGNLRSRPVLDSSGKPVQSKEAIRQRDALIAEVSQMSIPDGPLEMLFDAFGPEAVAENTGRSRRVVPKKQEDGSITRVEERRSLNHRTADVQAFQDGKKRILVFSDAGGTGKSYHADRSEKNQQVRIHYVLQPGWVASNAVQGFGRTHRSNEVTPPVYKLVTTNIKGQKRFTSTIARRLDQLGALTKGQRDTGSGMFGAKDNLETDLAKDSLREFYKRLGKNQIEGIDGMRTLDRLGLKQKFTDEYGGFKLNDTLARDISTFLNRILALEVEEQNTVFDAFISIYEMELEAAIQAGTLDTGMENVKADKIEVVDDKVIREDKNSGAATHYIQAKTYTKPKVVTTVDEMSTRRAGFEGLYETESGAVRAVYRIADKTTEWGAIQKQYRLVGPNQGAASRIWIESTLKSKGKPIDKADWQKRWDEEVAKVPEYNEDTLHMLTGALLPIWSSLPQEGNTKVKRLIAEDGSVYLGRVISKDMIDGVLRGFSIGRTMEVFTGQQVMDKAIKEGVRFQLTNNKVQLFRSRVSGEWRLEVYVPFNAWHFARQYPGIIQEKIQFRDRLFIPVGEKGMELLDKLLQDNPVRSTIEDTEEFRQRTTTLTDREVLAIAANELSMDGMSEAERSALTIFRDRLSKLEDLQDRRAKLGREYREQQFGANVDRAAAAETLDKMHAMDARIQEANAKVLDVEEKSVLRDVLKNARKVVEQKQKEHDTEILNRWRDRRNNAAAIKKYRQRIQKDVKTITDWALNPSGKDILKHIPDALKETVIPFLTSIDFTSKRQLDGGTATKADKAFMQRLENLRSILTPSVDTEQMYSEYDLPPQFFERLDKFIQAAQALTGSGDGTYLINKMTSEELKTLADIVSNLKVLIANTNKFHANAMFQHIHEAGDSTISSLADMKSDSGKNSGMKNFLLWEQIRPAYAFERFGEGGKAIYDGLRRGQAQLAFNAKKIIDFSENAYTAAEVQKWSKEVQSIELEDGSTIQLTTAAMMSFYELSKRKQALQHMLGGGIRAAAFKKKGSTVSDEGHLITIPDVERIVDALTPRQKEVADNIQQFMQNQGGTWGNHVSMKRFGEKLFGEDHYFPINSDGRHLQATADEKAGAGLYSLLNMGFTKQLTEGAKNRIILYNIFDVFANHMASMAQYHAMALPVLDAVRWYNYQQKAEIQQEVDGKTVTHMEIEDSVRDELARVFGTFEEKEPGSGKKGFAEKFILNILKGYNGTEAQGTPMDSSGLKMLHRYNRAQVAYNLRVVIQQPLAITRAGQIISYKSILRGMKLQPAAIQKNVQEMQRYSGIAAWKSLGFYDVNISRGLTTLIKQDEKLLDKVTEKGMWLAEKADEMTWAAMWSACKEEVILKQKRKPGDPGFYEAVTALFEDVVYKTQVVDSILTKNEFMRDKGYYARMSSSFMSEPVTTASMLMNAYDQYHMDMQRGLSRQQAWKRNRKNIGRTVYVYGVGVVLLAAAQAVEDAFRDDDDYQGYDEKWAEAYWDNFWNELSPFNKLPLVKDIWEAGKELIATIFRLDTYGNDPTFVPAELYNSLVNGATIITDKIYGNDTNYTYYAGAYKLLQAASGMFGIPLAATTREIIVAWNNTVGAMAPSLKVRSYDPGPKNNIKYAYQDGYLTAEEAYAELLEKGLVDNKNEAYWTVQEWDASGDSFSRYDAILQAVRSGSNIAAEMGELTSHGYSEDDVISHIKSSIGQWYQDGEITKQQAMNMLTKYTGLTTDEVTATVNKWSSKVVTGIAFDDIKDSFMAGTMTQSRAIEMQVRYGGLSQEEAKIKTDYWAFKRDYPDIYVDDAWFEKYYADVADSGMNIATYMEYRNQVKGVTGENKKERRMAIIHSLDISVGQKDALYFSEDWAASKLYEAPWH